MAGVRALKLIHNLSPPLGSFFLQEREDKVRPDYSQEYTPDPFFNPVRSRSSLQIRGVSSFFIFDLRPFVLSSICFARDEVAIRSSNRLWPHSRYTLLLVLPVHPLFRPLAATFISLYVSISFLSFPFLVLSPRPLLASISISILPLPPSFYLTRSLSPLSSLLSLSLSLCSSLSRFFVARSEPEVVWPGGGRLGFNYPILNCP